MRIVIDMQGAQNESRFRGIGRYTTEFVKHLILKAQERNIEIVLALNSAFPDSIEPLRAEFDDLLSQKSILLWDGLTNVEYIDPNNTSRRKSSELIREAFLNALNPDLILISELFAGAGDNTTTSIGNLKSKIPTAVIFYDLIPLAFEQEYLGNPVIKNWYHNKLEHLKKANLLLAISSFTKEEGIQYLKRSDDSIVNISSASTSLPPAKKEKNDSLLAKLNIHTDFILYCGGSDPRKNLTRLLSAYAALKPNTRERYQLVLAGKMPSQSVFDLKQHAKTLFLNEHDIIFTGYLSDGDLFSLYNQALGFVFPSYCEGFGLPALEAMMFDLPVIGSNVSSIPEVIGNPEAMFDPFSIASISQLMARLIEDETFRADLTTHAKKQRTKFSWAQSAEVALNAIEKTIAQNKSSQHLPDETITQTEEELIERIADVLQKNAVSETDLITISAAINTAVPRPHVKPFMYVDISELHEHDSKSGVQRVVRSTLKNLLLSDQNKYNIVPVYATFDHEYRLANRWLAKFKGESTHSVQDVALDPRNGDLFLGLDLQHYLTMHHEKYLTWLRHRGVQIHFVVYDLLPILMPHVFTPEMEVAHTAWLTSLAQFDGLIAISRAVADETDAWIKTQSIHRLRPLLINWFHLGADIDDSDPSTGLPSNATGVLNALKNRPTFLMVGTVEPRKGQAQTLAAFDLLWQAGVDVNLVVVGKKGWHVDALINNMSNHAELGQRLFWLDGISDEYLEKVYAASTCLIAASEGEGFGLPLIEAAQHQLPIIARDIPVFKEVAGEHAFYFNGLEPEDLSHAIGTWLDLNQNEQAPDSKHMPWLTWKQSTEQLLSVLLKMN